MFHEIIIGFCCSQANVTPVAKKRKAAAVEERPSRIGTRVSPRTIQRQTGLHNYKDTSSENASSDDSDQSEPEQDEMAEEEEVEQDADEEPEDEDEVVVKKVATPVVRKAGKKRGRKPKKRRPVKKKLAKIVEEEEEAEAEEMSESEKVALKKEIKKESEEPTAIESESDVKPDVKPDVKQDVEQDMEQDMEPETEPNGKSAAVTKKEESASETSKQRFTVSQLLQKFSHDSNSGEEEPTNPESKSDSTEAHQATTPQQDHVDTDPDRCTYDPFVFELIISSVEELLQWINKLKEVVNDQATKKRSSDAKLCDRLQALYDEAQPLAADQLDANEKIEQQLWKQWQRYRRVNADDSADADEFDDTDEEDDVDDTHHDVDDDDDDSSGQSDDGIRHSRRLRMRRAATNSQQGSTRSSSPVDDDPPKTSRKGYNYDPGWMDSESPSDSRRKSAHFDPEMKKPQYWIGRRMTRAAAAFAGSDLADEPEESMPSPSADTETDKSATTSENEPLVDQLRQLRRQQELLSSNDPKLPQSNGITSGNEKAAPASVGVCTPKASELLTKVRLSLSSHNVTTNRSHPPHSSPPANPINAGRVVQTQQQQQQQQVPSSTEKKILIQIMDPSGMGGSNVSLDITHVIQEAADKGNQHVHSVFLRVALNSFYFIHLKKDYFTKLSEFKC